MNSYLTTIRPLSELRGEFHYLFHIVESDQGLGAKNRGDEVFSSIQVENNSFSLF